MFKFNMNRNNREEKSCNNSIKALALVLLFCAVMASMVLKYSVKCDFGVSSGFHLDLSPAAYSSEGDSAYDTTMTDIPDPSPGSISALSE